VSSCVKFILSREFHLKLVSASPQDWTLLKLMTCHALNWNFIDFEMEREGREGERRNPL
jgi:hypothetical protein